jgi:hypothetical protein
MNPMATSDREIAGLKHHLLHLIQTHHVVSPIVELRCPRALMGRHLLRLFEVPAIGEVNRDTGRPEGVAADLRLNFSLPSSLARAGPVATSLEECGCVPPP